MRHFPLIQQLDLMDCGPTCLQMVCQFYGKNIGLPVLRDLCSKGQQGVTLYGICKTAEELGFIAQPLKLSLNTMIEEAPLPCIIHWKGEHFVVVYKTNKKHVFIADPEGQKLKLKHDEFLSYWGDDEQSGIVLLLEPTPEFYSTPDDEDKPIEGVHHIFEHLFKFKSYLVQLFFAASLGTILNLIFPFLTQALVDYGIGNQDLNFIYIIVLAQLVLFLSRTASEFIRGWILVHLGTRVNVSVLSEYLLKLIRLPLSFFDNRNLGDILQRVGDHKKIESFLTDHSLNVFFSLLNLIVFGAVMAIYSLPIFIIFGLGSILSIAWVTLFLKKRKLLDYQKFSQMSNNQNALLQLITGMPDIKLNTCESSHIWKWQRIQSRLFKFNLKSLAVEQYQQAGNLFFNEGKNIIITFMAAYQVVQGDLSLGMMMAVIYMLGQLNAPIEQLLSFIQMLQDAKISMERLSEVQQLPDEKSEAGIELTTKIPDGDINIRDLYFKYSRHDELYILNSLNVVIPKNKTTAIVGASGSGKTTLLKVLLKFFTIQKGDICVGEKSLTSICPDSWRKVCGVVMQDGFIFNDTILANIAMSDEKPDFERVIMAAKTANIHEEIESLIKGYNTKIGDEGISLSGGQKQRVLIARAIYKKPDFIFLDEATSALDANNEKTIQDNLQAFFKGRTVVVIAHRLSTVKHADQIIVLNKGEIVESGNHKTLSEQQGYYYNLVKNQLELGA
ncbi:peptidase domain-containing ABC transporter [Thalassotalea sp. 1_MG-2023]|uniref:peptidase domain-containing ABC transporter n=1 Tax=Thalassotalea sp. 1_MG-2023 TaxID=3062680 RepID=UPI0026E21157|nr:peptidase domain-containing ABC transporter [Thalassotalea sp. 1_MG-2023]MDO6428884.1 peptidase domain-containing ABC transporter [Thalassotalea sp. 1_MG-2023]